MDLNFKIDKQQLIRTDKEIIASYSKNFIQCNFCCQKQWSDIYKYALFINVKGEEAIVDLGIGKKVACKVPEEMLVGNFFYVSVFASDRITTTQQMVLVQPSGLNDQIINSFDDGSIEIIEDIDTEYRTDICECDKRHLYDPEHLYF